MQNPVLAFYISLMPVILGGICNSAFTKSSLFPRLRRPLDFGKHMPDGNRIFGDSKTLKGLLGYVVITAFCTVLWGWASHLFPVLTQHDYFYHTHANTLMFNLGLGALLGCVWALFELPNSFVKRRLDVGQSHKESGVRKILFTIFDQADSLFGVVLVLALFYPISLWLYLLFVTLGASTHILINFLLYKVKLRSNPV